MPFDAYYQARDILLDFIRRDAVGPVKMDEVLDEPPLESYVSGILWPRKEQHANAAEEPEDTILTDGDPEEEIVEVIRETNRYRPSVMALSFVLPRDTVQISFQFSAAVYEHSEVRETYEVHRQDEVQEKYRRRHLFTRQPLDTGSVTLELEHGLKRPLLGDRAVLRVSFRRKYQDGSCLWTVSIENCLPYSRDENENNCHALFQCELKLFGSFCPIDRALDTIGNEDRKSQDLLYRHTHQYAAGHGCSAAWDDDDIVDAIRSEFLPYADVPQMIASVPSEKYHCFHMNFWQDITRKEAIAELRSYVRSYRDWANQLSAEEIDAIYIGAADKALSQIELCAKRLDHGLDILENHPVAWQAFVYANEAMKHQSSKKRGQDETDVVWYPFQLCYIVMCLPDLVEPEGEWRDTVDLLWFPTGGGKTEAYLGVAAFAIFFRRLTQKTGGVTVLMRYTLRMLTAQQFERAAALICECELIRRREHIPGGEISIGMWVGSAVTPNHVVSESEDMESAESVLKALQQGDQASVTSSPIQMNVCPYCGEPLNVHTSFSIVKGSFRARCPEQTCPFHDELPIITVDDDIYARRPTLLISTIDKFARLAWEPRAGAIFATDGNGLPPSLLIQDELHLISGPLGSISGLYEIAIDRLCTRNGIGPKIIASTATVCNASGQIQALYGRRHFQFPPAGLDAANSFFAKRASAAERPERLYVGYCETGGSLVDAIVRTFGSITFALRYLQRIGTPDAVIDHFWTNVGYFNSLKDLGTADTLILDRVSAYAESLRRHKFALDAERVGVTPFEAGTYEYGELTSRKSVGEITDVRLTLDQVHYPETGAYSYILSSNMLSVGIDIARLGLMTVYGQPKTTAEYIQATSRVGRSNPGLVIVLLHMMRARDKGHFERFKTYHQALNRMVEPTSAAPYASRTLEKALHAVFVILIRHQIQDLQKDGDACNFRAERDDVQTILDELLTRIQRQSPESYEYAADLLEDFAVCWEDAAIKKGKHFRYTLANRSLEDTDILLTSAEKAEYTIFPPTMNSMRSVDTQSNVYLMKREARL